MITGTRTDGKRRTLCASALLLLLVSACQFRPSPAATERAPSRPATARPAVGTATPAAVPGSPTPQPPGHIVFTCQIFRESSRNQICSLDPDKPESNRLTADDVADHFYPSWAPDGRSIVYSSDLAGGYEIFEQPLLGPPHQLTHHSRAFAPAISPDGNRLAYTVRHEGDVAIWLANRDGTDPRWLVGQAWDATWSPDGAWILHASDRGGTIQLWVIRPDGRQLRQVTELNGLRGRSDWSPVGNRLATYAGPAWEREIVSFDSMGEHLRWLTDGGNNLAPSFSPDGRWIVFTSYKDRYRDDHGCEIYMMRVNEGMSTRLTDNDYCDWQPRWGP